VASVCCVLRVCAVWRFVKRCAPVRSSGSATCKEAAEPQQQHWSVSKLEVCL
jgi:hypothetical protein